MNVTVYLFKIRCTRFRGDYENLLSYIFDKKLVKILLCSVEKREILSRRCFEKKSRQINYLVISLVKRASETITFMKF